MIKRLPIMTINEFAEKSNCCQLTNKTNENMYVIKFKEEFHNFLDENSELWEQDSKTALKVIASQFTKEKIITNCIHHSLILDWDDKYYIIPHGVIGSGSDYKKFIGYLLPQNNIINILDAWAMQEVNYIAD